MPDEPRELACSVPRPLPSVTRRRSEPLVPGLPALVCLSPAVGGAVLFSTAARSFEDALLLFTKRCSAGSNSIPVSRRVEGATPGADSPAAIVRTTRVGAAVLTDSIGKESLELFLKLFQFPLSFT